MPRMMAGWQGWLLCQCWNVGGPEKRMALDGSTAAKSFRWGLSAADMPPAGTWRLGVAEQIIMAWSLLFLFAVAHYWLGLASFCSGGEIESIC